MQTALDILIRTKKSGEGITQVTAEVSNLRKTLLGGIENLTGFSIGSLGMGAALAAVGAGLKRAVEDTAAYGEQVRELSRISGASAEDTSRLIQAADDMGIEFESLEKAAQKAAKNGIAFTTEELAKLADQYRALKDPVERDQFLLDNFGKSGLEMGKAMELGGNKIREMAGAVSSSMILTKEQADRTRALEIAQDDWGDSIQGIVYNIGNELIPTVIEFLGYGKDFIQWLDQTIFYEKYVHAAIRTTSVDLAQSGLSYEEYQTQILKTIQAQKSYVLAIDDEGNAIGKNRFAKEQVIELNVALSRGEYEAATATKTFAGDFEREMLRVRGSTGLTKEAIAALARATQEELKKALEDLKTVIAGDVGGLQKEWGQKIKESGDNVAFLSWQIKYLEDLPMRTPEQEGQLLGLKQDLGKAKDELKSLADGFEDASKRMAFNMLMQKAASDGLTQTEVDNLTKIAVNWGLMDQATATTVQNLNSIDLDKADSELGGVDALLASIMGKPNSKTITITTVYQDLRIGDKGQLSYASGGGGSFTVPPGFPNDSYHLGGGNYVQSGEQVNFTVTPSGQGGGGGGGSKLPPMTVIINNGMDLEQFKQMLVAATK